MGQAKKKKKVKKKKKTKKVVSIKEFSEILPEDVLIEIFIHLPVESICNLRCVSKLWLSRLSNPSLLNKILTKNNSNTTLPWLLYYNVNGNKFSFVSPVIHSQFINHHDDGISLNYFERKLGLDLKPLASTNGLVLCSSRECVWEWEWFRIRIDYYVCNPLTKKWFLLPQTRRSRDEFGEYVRHGLISEESSTSSSISTTSFKVVRLGFNLIKSFFILEIFSSRVTDFGQWKTYKVSFPNIGDTASHFVFGNVVFSHSGVMCFIDEIDGREHKIIAYNLIKTKNNCGGSRGRLINLPDDYEEPNYSHDPYSNECLGESKGLICYGQIRRGQLSVWVLKEETSNGELVLQLVQKTNLKEEFSDLLEEKFIDDPFLKDFVHHMVDRRLIQLLSFSPVDRNIVILNCHKFMLAYNILTRRSEVLENPSMSAEYPKSTMREILPFVLTPRLTILRPCTRTVSSDYVFKEKKGWSYIARRLREEAMEVPTSNNGLDSLKT